MRFRKNRASKISSEEVDVPPKVTKICSFDGENASECKVSIQGIFKSEKMQEIGVLEELVCETPLESECNAFSLIISKKPPKVVASDNGKYVFVISSDKIKSKLDPSQVEGIEKASKGYESFHGVAPDKVFTVEIDDSIEYMLFFGHLKYIVYSVPNRSERRGTPFIHTARDRGDDKPPAKEKPLVCVSPNRDFLVMYGSEFKFTDRGIIG